MWGVIGFTRAFSTMVCDTDVCCMGHLICHGLPKLSIIHGDLLECWLGTANSLGHKANVIYTFRSWTKRFEDCTGVFNLDKFKISTYVVLIDAGFINTSGSCLLQFSSLFLFFNPVVLLPPATCFWSMLLKTFNEI